MVARFLLVRKTIIFSRKSCLYNPTVAGTTHLSRAFHRRQKRRRECSKMLSLTFQTVRDCGDGCVRPRESTLEDGPHPWIMLRRAALICRHRRRSTRGLLGKVRETRHFFCNVGFVQLLYARLKIWVLTMAEAADGGAADLLKHLCCA